MNKLILNLNHFDGGFEAYLPNWASKLKTKILLAHRLTVTVKFPTFKFLILVLSGNGKNSKILHYL